MRFLLDTHAFIWWSCQPDRLSGRALEICTDTGNAFFLSVASLWEIQIKQQLGKIGLAIPLQVMVQKQQEINEMNLLPVRAHHVYALSDLSLHAQRSLRSYSRGAGESGKPKYC